MTSQRTQPAVSALRCLLLIALVVAGCKGDGVKPQTGGTGTSSAVSSTSPANGATNVGTNAAITAMFNQPMTASSINNSSFTVTLGSIRIIGNVSFDSANSIATFVPSTGLVANTAYTATLSTGVEDATGNALAANYLWTFTTGAGPDTSAPAVSSVSPAGGATDAALNARITATFSKPIAASSLSATSFVVTAPGPVPIAGTVSYSGYTAVFTPTANLPANTALTATVAGTVLDLEGNPLSNGGFAWTFTTGAAIDAVAPAVSSSSIANGATGVPINARIAAFFSEAMQPASISTASFTLVQGTAPVAGTVTYLAGAATFNPLVPLTPNAAYTATISTGVRDLAGNAMAGAYSWSFTTGAVAQSVLPTVSLTNPVSGAINTPFNRQVAVTFSETMDPATVTTANFTLQVPGVSNVVGTVSDNGATAIFTPAASLLPGTQYTATISSGVTNLAGAALASGYVWSFYTSAITDTTGPTVSASQPGNQLVGVPINSKIAVTFSEALNAATVTNANFSLTGSGTGAVGGQVNAIGNIATFTPDNGLLANTTYLATITTGIEDLAGNALPETYTFSFTTGTAADHTQPAVSSTVPGTGATGVFVNQAINISFSKAMDPATISAASFSLAGPGTTAVPGTVIFYPANNVASFVPLGNLQANTVYSATVSAAVRDLQGNALPSSAWSFTTGNAAGGLAAVNLGSLAGFAVVGGAGLNNSNLGGQTTINGNAGLSPSATCLGDGAPCSATDPVINGTLYANDVNGVAAQAKADLAAAYSDATGRASGTLTNDLTGKVLTPGVYTTGAAMSIAAGGTLTLDARGDPNAVWIFQIGSTLTVNSNAQVSLINGARAANVFWAVASAATVGASAGLQGNVLSRLSINTGVNSMVSGRLLSATGAVTLLNTTVTLPGP